MKKESLTSVKINSQLWEDFKIQSIRDKISLHDLVNISILLYLTDEKFKEKINERKLHS